MRQLRSFALLRMLTCMRSWSPGSPTLATLATQSAACVRA